MKRLIVIAVLLLSSSVAMAWGDYGSTGRGLPRQRFDSGIYDGGWRDGRVDYGFNGWYGWPCRDENEAFYGPGSVSDSVFGWRADRVLSMQEKEQEFRHEQIRRAEDKELFERANQAGKLQHQLEQAEKKIAELEAKLNQPAKASK